MRHKLGIKPYHQFSKSGRELRRSLGLARYNSNHTYDLLINWGSQRDDGNAVRTVNKEVCIKNSSDKLRAFSLLKESNIRVPKHTVSMYEAKDFNYPVLCRLNNLMGGNGIHVALTPNDLVKADFYVEYITPINEFRVHVFENEIIAWSKKIPKSVNSDKYIRNHAKGYKFSLCENGRIYSKLKEYAIESIKCLKLDFGAVDIILSENHKFFVLEVNTAIGVEGTVLRNYANKIKEVAYYGWKRIFIYKF